MKNAIHNQRGAVIVIFALSLVVLIGFVAIGTEVGRWYHVRAELSKAVDAAAIAGAANISNTTIDHVILAQDFGMENFQPGYLGTPATGDRAVSFAVIEQDGGRISVTGRTTSVGVLSRLFGVEYVPTSAAGLAQKNRVEIILVLDRSGSMDGAPIRDLKTAARAFLGYYEDTQDEDRIGLVTFATGVSLRPPATNFFTPITNSINAMAATGATNAEDALARAGAAFTDQTGVSAANRIQQFIVFFTDGRPTAFRSTFRRNNQTYDRVIMVTGNCNSNSDAMYNQMGYPNNETLDQTLPYNPTPTGDGLPTGSTRCQSGRPLSGYVTTRWGSFAAYPVPGMGSEAYPAYCSISSVRLNGQNGYICRTASQMAIDHASTLKSATNLGINGVQIYTIGLGNNVNAALLSTISSGQGYAYVAPTSSELEAIFRSIAKQIKLRLVQ
jgi:uncharacterized protein YegL